MRYLQLIFVFIFVFIGLLNVIFRVAASKRKKREQAGTSGNLPPKMKKVGTLIPGEAREYEDEKINAEPADGFTEAAVRGRDEAGLTSEADIEKPVLTGDTAAGSSRMPVTGQKPVSSLLKTDTSPGYERFASGMTERFGGLTAHGSNMSGTDIKRDHITSWEKINKLSMLKRAVVMSEILGPPKGSV